MASLPHGAGGGVVPSVAMATTPQSPHPLVSACGTPTSTTPNPLSHPNHTHLSHQTNQQQQQQYHHHQQQQQQQLSMAAAAALTAALTGGPSPLMSAPGQPPSHLSAVAAVAALPAQASPQTSSSSPLVDNCSVNNCATLVIGNLDSNCTEEQLNCILHRCVKHSQNHITLSLHFHCPLIAPP